ncbi:hypothetical protein ACFPC0_17805 [Streptomyces andamanensis]|uniref:Uncharacterized protein n=1 Tax=Streptomyces andamanensis TaxID=1565035 RepID=A0ABV8TG88_9ACTN
MRHPRSSRSSPPPARTGRCDDGVFPDPGRTAAGPRGHLRARTP